LQSFGLAHISVEELPRLMPDMARHLGQCRFHNCRHRQEPGCAIHAAISEGSIANERLVFLQRLQDELSAAESSKY
jgi:ribosome biogenesis GTPase